MRITFLQAKVPLTKSFALSASGELQKTNYPHVLNFTSHTEEIRSLPEFHRKLEAHAKQHHCLLKGELQRPLNEESRANSTDANSETSWLCLDIDGIKDVQSVEDVLSTLPKELHHVDYIVQYSASMGVDVGKGLSAHVFMLLDQPYLPAALKDWLQRINLTVQLLRDNITLNRPKAGLKWPLDISVAQNDKLIYIAPPNLGKGIKDILKGKRIQLVKKNHRVLRPDLSDANAEQNRTLATKLLNDLRKAEGLEPRRYTGEKTVGSTIVAKNPGVCTVTGVKKDRGFVYLNINNGDSWGYYHPESNPDILYNFKGEPNYLTKELLPDYYKQAKHASKPQPEQGIEYLAFLDVRTDAYFRGYYDKATNYHEIHRTSQLTKLHDFLKQHGQPVPDFIEEWDVEFRFDEDTTIDRKHRFVNMYTPSEYLSTAQPHNKVPPTIHKVIWSALGSDQQCYDHFLNWLACILQHRTKVDTAWILHGTQGTGKGLLFNQILTPLVGRNHTSKCQLSTLEQPYNGFIEQAVFVLIDEVQISEMTKKGLIMSRLKEIIAEPILPIRRMRTDQYTARNFSHFILASNKHDPAEVDPDDRRFNVAKRQEKKLHMTKEQVERIKEELPQFAGYLLHCAADLQKARTPLANKDRERLQRLTRDSGEAVADAIRNGDFAFLFENRPEDEDPGTLALLTGTGSLPTYKEALAECMAAAKGSHCISRNTMETLFFYITGNAFKTRHKFTKFLAHKGIDIERVKLGGKTVAGTRLNTWHLSPEVEQEYQEWIEPKAQLRKVS